MKKVLAILICFYNLLWAQANISKQDSLFFLIPRTGEYLDQGTLNVDTLKKICPVDTVDGDLFGFTAGRMNDNHIRWFFNPRLPAESMWVAFIPPGRLSCTKAAKLLGSKQASIYPARKLWVAQAEDANYMTNLQYVITCDGTNQALLIIAKRIHSQMPQTQ